MHTYVYIHIHMTWLRVYIYIYICFSCMPARDYYKGMFPFRMKLFERYSATTRSTMCIA